LTRPARTRSFPFVAPKSLRRAAVICHRNADADAYLSGFALSRLISALSPKCFVEIVTPEGMTSLTEKLRKRFQHRTVEASDSEYDIYVAVDVGDTELLREWKAKMASSAAEKVLIDHHPLRDRRLYDHVIVDERATSAAEIVLRLFRELKISVDRKTAQALLEGILFDSSHLAIAGEEALRGAVFLLDRGAKLGEARRALRKEPDYGEVVARLRGAQRLEIYRLGSWVAATSRVGSFQAHVARALLLLGADVSIVGGVSDGETRVSLRATQRFYEATNVELGTEVAERVAGRLGGHGGGHATAASFACAWDDEEAIRLSLQKVGELVKAVPENLE